MASGLVHPLELRAGPVREPLGVGERNMMPRCPHGGQAAINHLCAGKLSGGSVGRIDDPTRINNPAPHSGEPQNKLHCCQEISGGQRQADYQSAAG